MIRLSGILALLTCAFIAGVYVERMTSGGTLVTVARKSTIVQLPIFVYSGHETNVEVEIEPCHNGLIVEKVAGGKP